MRLRSFTASDMPSAMKLVRQALGDHAIILSSTAGARQVSVTAAVEEADESPIMPSPAAARAASRESSDDIRYELQSLLRFHNIPELFIAKLMQQADGSRGNLRQALTHMLERFFAFDSLAFAGHDMRLMLVGTPGIGKTLTIAKLATKLAMDKQPLAVITADNSRAGGIEQLQAFTTILDLELHVISGRQELEALLKTLPPRMRALIDTAGCAPYNRQEFGELEELATLPGIEPVLVMPAGGDSMEAIDMAEIFSQLPVKRLLVTRADTARRFGGILSAAAAHGLAFCNVSRSPSMSDRMQPLEAETLAQLLLKYKES